MKYFIVIVIIAFSSVSKSTAFSMGDGNYWKQICAGQHDELETDSAIASCMMLLMGHQIGAYHQAGSSNTNLVHCSTFEPNLLPKQFVAFISSDVRYEKMDIIQVLYEFTKLKEGRECAI